MAKFAHWRVKKIAIEMANEVYEEKARDDKFYKVWPKRNTFVAKWWKHFVNDARATLAHMLTMPGIDESLKDEIYEALLLDKTLPKGGDKAVTAGILH